MSRTLLICASLVALLVGCPRPGPTVAPPPVVEAARMVSVTVTVPARPEVPLEVELAGLAVAEGQVTLRAARGAVGAYATFPFHEHLQGLVATDGRGAALQVAEQEPGIYRVDAPESVSVTVRYQVDTARGEGELEDFMVSSHRREGYALLSGYATYLLADSSRAIPHRVRLLLPSGWRAAWALPRSDDGWFVASTAFELLDEPMMAGARIRTVPVPEGSATPLAFVHVWSEEDEDPPQLPALVAATAGALDAARALELPPLGRPYHVFFEYYPESTTRELGWALEHGASVHGADTADRHHEPSARLTYHVTHHMLHSWLPRRLYTDQLHPDRQLRAEPTEAVWLAEGFPQYLTYVGMGRAELADPEVLLVMLGRRFVQPYVTEAPPEPRSMTALSLELSAGRHEHWVYGFAEGGLLALWLDEQLGARSVQGGDLATATLRLLEGMEARSPSGVPEGELEGALAEATGLELEALWARHVAGTAPLPLEEILGGTGLGLSDGAVELIPEGERSAAARAFVETAFGPLRLEPGDRVVYEYSGSFSSAPVRLTEGVLSREGLRLELQVTAERGEERRQWIQVVTDTEDNRRGNVVDELYIVEEGERRRLENEDNIDLLRLYEWTLPSLDGPPAERRHEEVTLEIAGARRRCLRETLAMTSEGRPATMVTHECPRFRWRHGPASLVDRESGEVLWQIAVTESGREVVTAEEEGL